MNDLEYLQRAIYRQFPRDAKGLLKVSQVTKELVQTWVEANRFDKDQPNYVELDVYAALNERLDFDEWRSMRTICEGFTSLEAAKISSRMSEFVARGFIERSGSSAGSYRYRLVRLLVRMRGPYQKAKAPDSALDKLKAKEVAARYA
jgi:hypothetical protein